MRFISTVLRRRLLFCEYHVRLYVCALSTVVCLALEKNLEGWKRYSRYKEVVVEWDNLRLDRNLITPPIYGTYEKLFLNSWVVHRAARF